MGLNEAGRIEMEEQSLGESLEEKLEDFAEVIPDYGGNSEEQNRSVNETLRRAEQVEVNKEVDESPVPNGHSIVTEATIEAQNITDLDKSMSVSAFSWLVLAS